MNDSTAKKQSNLQPNLQFLDFHPPRVNMHADVLSGLSKTKKMIMPKYFYDARGSRLFDNITRLPEYYLTRTEDSIMTASLDEIAQLLGPGAAVIEFGSGSGEKIRRLLSQLHQPVACVPVEISRGHLMGLAQSLAKDHPQLEIIAVCADFTLPLSLPPISGARRKLVFFPGSTIGNFRPDDAINILKVMRQVAGEDGALLIGADLVKDASKLEAAYNDSQGITAAFNLNLLQRINSELQANFDLEMFRHQAVWNGQAGRIEMYLVSLKKQDVHIQGQRIAFARGERILTEYSHKYELESFAAMAGKAGLEVAQVWTDTLGQFSVQFLTS